MKLTFILLITTLLNVNASSYSQKTKISLNLNDVTVEQVFSEIMNKTDFKILYSPGEIELQRKVSIKVKKQRVEKILDILFANSMIKYNIVDKQIVLVRTIPKKGVVIPKNSIKKKQSLQNEITGKVVDESGEALPGVNIIIEGTTKGTVTDFDGLYTIQAAEGDILVFSFVGMQTQKIKVGLAKTINVTMLYAENSLDEVIVVGYGTQSRVKITGAISKINADEMTTNSTGNFANQLKGKIAGVQINESSGQPGSNSQISIRGTGTLTAGSSPLIVVDGVPLTDGSSLNFINPDDIESLSVLKDAASAAIYGSRAANGVIVITTKQGKTGKMTVSLNISGGVQVRSDKEEYADAYESALFFTEARDWGYVSKDPDNRSIEDDRDTRISNGASKRQLRLHYVDPWLNNEPGLTNTDWLDVMYRPAAISSYNLSFSGGNDRTSYYISGNYFDQDGIVIETGFKRYNSLMKIDSKLSDRVDFGINTNMSYSKQKLNYRPGSWTTDPLSMVFLAYPLFAPTREDGSLAISDQLIANTPEDGALQENPYAVAKTTKSVRNEYRAVANTYFNFKLAKGLSFKTMLGTELQYYNYDYFTPSYVGTYRNPAPKATQGNETLFYMRSYLTENTLRYNQTFGNHDIDVIAGYTYQQNDGGRTFIKGTDYPDDDITNIAGAINHTVDEYRWRWTQVSYLARAQYFFKQRYQLVAAIRRDGSSRFGDDSKWGTFPSVSAGWLVSDESFFPKTKMLTFMKLRGSWGQSGNNQVGTYSSKAIVSSYNYVWGEQLVSGSAPSSAPNRGLSWETNTSFNIGFDLGFWHKFNISMNYYNAITSDLLLKVPVPQQSGYTTSLQNIGEVKNTGFELELTGNVINLGPVKWRFTGNISTNKNEVLALAPGQEQIVAGHRGLFVTKVGGSIAEIYGYKVIGVYKTQEEIDNSPHLDGTVMGDDIVEDVNDDGVVDEDDRISFGTYAPDFTYGFTSTFQLKGFELGFGFEGIQGRTIYDFQQVIREDGAGFGVPSKYYFDNRYHPEHNPDGFLHQPNSSLSSARLKTLSSNMYFPSGDYLRLRYLNLSYNLPKTFLSKIRFDHAKIYLNVDNLFTITEFRGRNIDVQSSNILTNGYSASGTYSVPKTFTIGLNIKF